MKHKLKDLVDLPEKMKVLAEFKNDVVAWADVFGFNNCLDQIGEIEVEVDKKMLFQLLNNYLNENVKSLELVHIIAENLKGIQTWETLESLRQISQEKMQLKKVTRKSSRLEK